MGQMYILVEGAVDFFDHCQNGCLHLHLAGVSVFSETVLWANWHHKGTLIATKSCTFANVLPVEFAAVVSRSPEVHDTVCQHARCFVRGWKASNCVPSDYVTVMQEQQIYSCRRSEILTAWSESSGLGTRE